MKKQEMRNGIAGSVMLRKPKEQLSERYLEDGGLIQQMVNVCHDFDHFTPFIITITQSSTTLLLPPSRKHLKWQSL